MASIGVKACMALSGMIGNKSSTADNAAKMFGFTLN